MFRQNGFNFSFKRADDLFVRSNSDGDNAITVDEFINIYMKELEDAEESRKKLVENMMHIRQRNKGYCYKFTRLFAGSDFKSVSSQKGLDSYNQNKLKDEINELQNFTDKLQKKTEGTKKRGAFVLGNANTKLAIEDADDLNKITNFFKVYGKEQEVTTSDFEVREDGGNLTDDDFLLPTREKKTDDGHGVSKDSALRIEAPEKSENLVQGEKAYTKSLDRKKIDVLVNELSEHLNYEDIYEIKKQINILNK